MRKIADCYHCEESDIKSNNLHITDFKNLLPGTKLRIPFLTKETMETLEETESFISDYYPSFTPLEKPRKEEEIKVVKDDEKPTVLEDVSTLENKVSEPKIEKPVEQKKEPLFHHKKINYYGNVIPDVPESYIRKI